MFDYLQTTLIQTGNGVLTAWLLVVLVSMTLMALSRIFTQIKKIQNRTLRWKILRHEVMWSALNLFVTGLTLTLIFTWLAAQGWMATYSGPVRWYVVAGEFALFFFAFDLYFYLLHRLIHIEPLYTWVHRTHHRSVAPHPLSSSSMSPLEGIITGLSLPAFFIVFTVHDASMAFILPFATLMGLYVHCGYEIVPRWWYRSPLTKWLITPMFHDQHHQYVGCNYGGFTTIWDRVFGTVRPRFFSDFDRLKGNPATADSLIEEKLSS